MEKKIIKREEKQHEGEDLHERKGKNEGQNMRTVKKKKGKHTKLSHEC